MGQAFDRDGNVLGEAEGATKREVFDKLIQEHPHAHEIQIKALRDKLTEIDNVEKGGGPRNEPAPTDRMLQFFSFAHLPAPLQAVSRPFCDLAATIVATLPSNPERTVALRKLLEAKDCAVRALLFK